MVFVISNMGLGSAFSKLEAVMIPRKQHEMDLEEKIVPSAHESGLKRDVVNRERVED